MKLNNFIRFAMVLALVFASTSGMSKGKSPHERPFWGSLNGEVTFPWSDACLKITGAENETVSEVRGKMTHMGKTVLFTTHCATADGSAALNGQAVFVAANGDEVFAAYTAQTTQFPTPTQVPPIIGQEITMVIYGGTGRFENAAGNLEGMVYIEFQGIGDPSWPLKFVLAGWIVY